MQNQLFTFIKTNFKLAMIGKYIAILILMALPFVNVSCSGIAAASLSGYDLAVGTTIEQPSQSMFGKSKPKKVPAEVKASVALAAALAGLVAAVAMRGGRQKIGVGAAGIVGTVALVSLMASLNSRIAAETRGVVTLQWTGWIWLTVILFAASAAAAIWLIVADNRQPAALPQT